jgi:AraC family transcriptional regulator of arabinose operon
MNPSFSAVRLNNTPRYYRCEPGWSWAPPPLSDYDLWCVAEGEGHLYLNGRGYTLGAGICFLLPPGSAPRADQNPQRRLHVFAVHFDLLSEDGGSVSSDTLNSPPQGWMVRDPLFFHTLARRCEATWGRGDDLGKRQAQLLVEQMLLQLWEEAALPEVSPTEERIRNVIRAIQNAPGEEWPVDEQARQTGLSRSQYTRRFTQMTGLPPAQFVVRARLDRATQLLRETTMTVSEIAEVLGYRDVYFFSRQFKQHRGVAPSGVRGS